MKILEKQGICMVLMIVLVVLGILLGGWKGLASQSSKVTDVFFQGEDKDGICVANDMSERATGAINLVTIASKYDSIDSSLTDQVTAAASELQTAVSRQTLSSIGDCYSANNALDTAFTALYQEMGSADLSDKDAEYREKLYASFNSRANTISHDPYLTYAADYNDLLRGFPASLIASLTPISSAAVSY